MFARRNDGQASDPFESAASAAEALPAAAVAVPAAAMTGASAHGAATIFDGLFGDDHGAKPTSTEGDEDPKPRRPGK